MLKTGFMIYGAYGYTGNLIAELACQQGLKPVLGGRNKTKLIEQAKRLGLAYRVFDIADKNSIKQYIMDFVSVVHCAGPFYQTYQPMAQACIESKTHYIDVTGEYNVIEGLKLMDVEAKAARIMLLPGAGFDVVPSDCLANYLKHKIPHPTHLLLAIKALQSEKSAISVSRGTAKTFMTGFHEPAMIRDQGKLQKVSGIKIKAVDFGTTTNCLLISWGDIASAFYSTHIPHIETYLAMPARSTWYYRLISPFKIIFKLGFINEFLQNRINKMPEGPSAQELSHGRSQIYGEVSNASGTKAAAILDLPNGYALTAQTVLLIINKTLRGQAPYGFQTPATAYGADLILECSGVNRKDVMKIT